MPDVMMPDGTLVAMPDRLSPEQIVRLKSLAGSTRQFGNASDVSVNELEQGTLHRGPFRDQLPKDMQRNLESAERGVEIGLGDVPQGVGQLLLKTLPDSAISAIDRLHNYAASKGFGEKYPEGFRGETEKRDIVRQLREREMEGKVDWPRIVGNVPAAAVLGSAGGTPQTVMGAVGQGAKIGGLFGLTQPVSGPEESFWPKKAVQTGVGSLIGGAIPATLGGGRWLWQKGKDIARMATPRGVQKLFLEGVRENVGKQNVQKVAEALKKAKPIVPGTQPTAAEAVAGMPEGSPIIAHQKVVSRISGGPSAEFGKRAQVQTAARAASIRSIAKNKAALRAAEKARDTATEPMRTSALSGANQGGGVNSPGLLRRLAEIEEKPGLRASDVVSKTVGDIRKKIASLTDERLKINADDLYTIRKEIGTVIRKYADESKNFDQRLAAGIQKDIQRYIDDAIEKSGGAGWKAYLQEYVKLSKPIEQMKVGTGLSEKLTDISGKYTPKPFLDALRSSEKMIEKSLGVSGKSLNDVLTPAQMKVVNTLAADAKRSLEASVPLQPTNLGSYGVDIARLPRILKREIVIANHILNKLNAGLEQRLGKVSSDFYLNPKTMGEELLKIPPDSRKKVMDAFLNNLYKHLAVQTSGISARGVGKVGE